VSRLLRAVGIIAIPVVSLPLGMAAAEAATVPKPPSKTLPAALDIASPYQPQTTCDPVAKPGAVAFAELMKAYYARTSATTYGISRNCNSGVTEHSEGRAVDWMLNVNSPTQKAIADSVTQWLSAPDAQGRPGAMARRFGIMYIIWNRKMWRAYDPGRGWAPYSGPVPHTDHIHFSFSWDGAMERTSWWTGKALTVVGGKSGTTPAPNTPTTPTAPPAPPAPTANTPYPTLSVGATGPDVAVAQKALKVTADGAFGPQTLAALKAWQTAQKLPVTGVLDAATWTRMIALRLVPSRPVAGTPSTPPTTGTPTTGTPTTGTPAGQTQTGVAKTRTVANPGAATAYTALMGTVLKTGARGESVKALQRALGGLSVDGQYGDRTATAVKTFQKANQLKVTGVADKPLWTALERRDYPMKPYYGTVLRLGSEGAAVKALQTALRLQVTGVYDLGVVSAVKQFQGSVKLASTGSVATVTWQAIEAKLRRR
jgi:peptidoglycan hydrolase-like protein with peptidoglycan-binding domain